ncbi:MAG: hypothetical protein ACRYHQ_20325 [Janthinobacterium lividum]
MSDLPIVSSRLDLLASPMTKLGLILLLTLLLQMPLLAMSSLIGRSWGPPQTVTAPTLAIPYDWTEPATTLAPAQRHRG